MAKNKSEENTNVETTENTTQGVVAPAVPATTSDHVKMIKLQDGTVMKRADYIRDRWVNGKVSRGQIAKELTELNKVENGGDGKKIPYQVVFAVIKKGTPGGPDPVAAPATGEAAGAEQAQS